MEYLHNKKYDYIIYGGSITGVIKALLYKKEGVEVLLVNKYGFLGGGITENLNLIQNINTLDVPILNKVILHPAIENKLSKNIQGNEFLINPEKLKFVLQDLLVENEIDLLFHVKAIEPVKDNKLVLSGKEGKIIVEGKNIIDCSDNFYLHFLNGKVNYTNGVYNFVVVGNDENKLKKLLPDANITQISDNRYLINLIINFDDILFVETITHKLMNKLTNLLIENNYRIELLPVETYLNPKLDKNYFIEDYQPILEYRYLNFDRLFERSIFAENQMRKYYE